MTPTEIEQGRLAAIEKILYPACFEIAKQIMERMKDVALVPERVWNSAATLEEVKTEWADYINDKCASALSTHFQSLLAEKDAEIEKLRKDKDWLWQVNQQKDKQIAELMEASNTWKPMFLDQARIIRQLEEENKRLRTPSANEQITEELLRAIGFGKDVNHQDVLCDPTGSYYLHKLYLPSGGIGWAYGALYHPPIRKVETLQQLEQFHFGLTQAPLNI